MAARFVPGTQIPLGKLAIGKQIGGGGFGVVHDAKIVGIDYPFAVKFLDPHPGNSPKAAARARFFREAEILFRLRHPSVVAIYGVGEYEGRPYILMERFRGLDLVRIRERKQPEPEAVLPFVESIAEALGYAHSHGFVHRDIKPRNLMAARGARETTSVDSRVLDFGIAAVLDPDGTRLTRTGGTAVGDSFSAPELSDNPRLVHPQCDVYSLGASWFWFLTGQTPKGVNWEEALRSSVTISADYERVLLRCLEQANRRYATMDELVSELRALRAGARPAASADSIGNVEVVVLGAIAEACSSPGSTTTYYHVEQALRGRISKFLVGVANRKLLRLKMTEPVAEFDHNGEPYEAVRPTAAGEKWVEEHHSEIEAALHGPTKSIGQVAKDDEYDIPF